MATAAVAKEVAVARAAGAHTHSKAQGVVARAYANAQRGVVGTPDELRELDEAQRVVRSTDRAVRDGVRQQLRTV